MTTVLQKFKLKYLVGYGNPQRYWNKRWGYGEKETKLKEHEPRIREIMTQTQSHSILDVGCGPAALRNLQGYLGLDFSLVALQKSDLTHYLYADFTEHIPLPDESFDCALCANVLLHVPPSKIERAVGEVCRVTRRAVILLEARGFRQSQPHCFCHNIPALFRQFNGQLFILNEET